MPQLTVLKNKSLLCPILFMKASFAPSRACLAFLILIPAGAVRSHNEHEKEHILAVTEGVKEADVMEVGSSPKP